MGHMKSPGDLLIGQAGGSQLKDLRLAWRQARRTGRSRVPVNSHGTLFSGAITHRLITRCYEFREYVIT